MTILWGVATAPSTLPMATVHSCNLTKHPAAVFWRGRPIAQQDEQASVAAREAAIQSVSRSPRVSGIRCQCLAPLPLPASCTHRSRHDAESRKQFAWPLATRNRRCLSSCRLFASALQSLPRRRTCSVREIHGVALWSRWTRYCAAAYSHVAVSGDAQTGPAKLLPLADEIRTSRLHASARRALVKRFFFETRPHKMVSKLLLPPGWCIPCCSSASWRLPVMLVRNPYRRVFSYFRHKWLSNEWKKPLTEWSDLPEFLRRLAEHRFAGDGNFWMRPLQSPFTEPDLYHTLSFRDIVQDVRWSTSAREAMRTRLGPGQDHFSASNREV